MYTALVESLVNLARRRRLRNYYIGFGLFLQTAGLVTSVPAGAQTIAVGSLDQLYPYEARDMRTSAVLDDFSRYTGVPVRAEDIDGTVTISNRDGSAQDFLNQFAASTNALWWSDGVVIHVEPRQGARREVVAAAGVDMERLKDVLGLVGLDAGQATMRATADGKLIVISGPDGYVRAVRGVMDQVRAASAVEPPKMPKIYKGGRALTQTPGASAPQSTQSGDQR